MKRYTTPTMALIINKPELTDAAALFVTFKQGSNVLTIDDNITITPTDTGVQLEVELTQLQTSGFNPGNAQIQVNWLETDGKRGATEVASVSITDNLLNSVLPYPVPEA